MPLLFVVGSRDIAYLVMEAAVVLPVDPFDGGELGLVLCLPGSAASDQFSLVGSVEAFGHGVVIAFSGQYCRGSVWSSSLLLGWAFERA